MHIIAPHSAESWAEPISQSPLEMLTTEVPKSRGEKCRVNHSSEITVEKTMEGKVK